MMNEDRNGSDDTAKRVDFVLNNLRDVLLDDRMGTHGHPGLFAHVFANMMRPYLFAIQQTGRNFEDQDSFAVFEMMKLARRACTPVSETMETALHAHDEDAAGYGILRAAYSLPPAVVESFYSETKAEDGASAAVFEAGWQYNVHGEEFGGEHGPLPDTMPVSDDPTPVSELLAIERVKAEAEHDAITCWNQGKTLVYGCGRSPENLAAPTTEQWPADWTQDDRAAVRVYLVSRGLMQG